ncbi:MAG: hypothetical protein K0R25_1013 [Rickettsiaceae bacterium]|jgi:hypothetical protein|nr:hypothetical protein [Rickettsiaceae bacterium]
MTDSFLKAFTQRLEQEQEELKAAKEVTEAVFPVIDKLTRSNILNPVVLKTKLAALNPKYRDAVYGLCRISTDAGPEGSFIVLDPKKVLSIIEEIETEEQYENRHKNGKKFILGITKKVANSIKSLVSSKLSALCYLINDLIRRKIIEVPSPDAIKGNVKVTALAPEKSREH